MCKKKIELIRQVSKKGLAGYLITNQNRVK